MRKTITITLNDSDSADGMVESLLGAVEDVMGREFDYSSKQEAKYLMLALFSLLDNIQREIDGIDRAGMLSAFVMLVHTSWVHAEALVQADKAKDSTYKSQQIVEDLAKHTEVLHYALDKISRSDYMAAVRRSVDTSEVVDKFKALVQKGQASGFLPQGDYDYEKLVTASRDLNYDGLTEAEMYLIGKVVEHKVQNDTISAMSEVLSKLGLKLPKCDDPDCDTCNRE